uniref:MAP3K HisK-N-like globin domain-containing protein n=2 Tax=Panagrolaimus sp. JU765 TaxID=591449 RepID=A0AC34QJY1_9BILA
MPSSSQSIAEENSFNSFFNLQKDVELRKTLSGLMVEHEAEIIERWKSAVETEMETCTITEEMLKTLLKGLRNYILNKESDALSNVLQEVENQIPENQGDVSQLTVALCLFPSSIQPALKHRGIKPHWMFTLDDLIRSGVQVALNILAPEQPAHNFVQEANKQYGQNVAAIMAAANNAALGIPSTSTVEVISSGTWNHTPTVEMGQQHIFYATQIRKLFEDLVGIEKEYKTMLEQAIMDRKQRTEELAGTLAGMNYPVHFPFMTNQPPISVVLNHKNPEDEETLADFLARIGCGAEIVQLIEKNHYTKNDLIDFVTREELMAMGIPGGVSCLIWREILRSRMEFSQTKFAARKIARKSS